MQELIAAIDSNIATGNWYSALFVALSLPDVCGKIEYPERHGSQRNYADWFNRFVADRYTHRVGAGAREVVFLSGNDCYALRCAYLHEGSDDVTRQRAREAVDKFHFIVAPHGCTIHCNMMDTKLQLQVDIFCRDIRDGVIEWLASIEGHRTKRQATQQLLLTFPPQLEPQV
nr:hypothetical protein [Oceanococcus sp. HetDA_MAG_MS8]